MKISSSFQTIAKYNVIGYVYNTPSYINASEMTHVNYAFGEIINNKVLIPNIHDLKKLVSLKANNPNLKVIFSIGGWGADGFSDAAYSDYSRNIFAKSCLDILRDYELDGIDIDWEYPVFGACELIKCRPQDKENFTLLLQAIRYAIGYNKILSIAAGADKFYIINTEMNKISLICDYINLMTYDFNFGSHNANLYPTSLGYGSILSCDESVNMFINAGVPPVKINLGIPFFGLKNKEHLPYNVLVKEYINKNGWKRYWDNQAKATYLKKDNSFITYEDPYSIKYKIRYIKSQGIGGAMFWEYNEDYKEVLLNELWTGLNGKQHVYFC